MAKKPYSCNWVCAGPNQVNSVTRLIRGHAIAMSISDESTNDVRPNRMKQNGPPFGSQLVEPQRVCHAMAATASTGTTVSTAAKELSTGIQAGTGAPGGMPHQVPKKISIQNANSAR